MQLLCPAETQLPAAECIRVAADYLTCLDIAQYMVRQPSNPVDGLPDFPAMNGHSPYASPANGREATIQPELLRPIPQGHRRVSGTDTTPVPPVLNGHVSNATLSDAATPATPENDSPQWCSAVGHAATGKSGRVIERLMVENDKLKRELELANLRAQELEKSLSVFRPQMEALRQENENLSHARSVDSSLLGRRDRKIEELKSENASRGDRMKKAESLVRQLQREVEEVKAESERKEQGLAEQTKHATVHAEILETSHRQLGAEYRARREAWERDLGELLDRREADRQRLARLDVVHEQMRSENEKTRRVQTEMRKKWEEIEMAMRRVIHESDDINEKTRKKSESLEEVLSQMRWVVELHKDGNGAAVASGG